jgi:hypothetical protein
MVERASDGLGIRSNAQPPSGTLQGARIDEKRFSCECSRSAHRCASSEFYHRAQKTPAAPLIARVSQTKVRGTV